MRKLASITIYPMLSFVLTGCSADSPPSTPLVKTPATDATSSSQPVGKAGRKKTSRKPKPPGVVPHDVSVNPIAR